MSILYVSNSKSYAQVTIGSSNSPNKGALLDLKEDNKKGANSDKGLSMPRVKLTSLTATNDDLKTTIEGAASTGNKKWDLKSHIGLVIYNVNVNECMETPIYDGLHVWDGDKWQFLGKHPTAESYEITDSRDGEVYLARNFGEAGDWMLENLRYNPILHPDKSNGFDGDTFIESADNPSSKKVFFYAVDSIYTPSGGEPYEWEKYKKNGIYYNWYAATNGQNSSRTNQGELEDGRDPTPRIQGICPKGWHLPSDKEWNDLEKEIYEKANKYSTFPSSLGIWDKIWNYGNSGAPGYSWRPYGITVNCHGTAMKSQCSPYGTNEHTSGKSFSAKYGGFNALLTGRILNSNVEQYGRYAYFWTSSSGYNDLCTWIREVENGTERVNRISTALRKSHFNVRCKKDEPSQ